MTKIASAENIRARLWDRGNEVECEVWGTNILHSHWLTLGYIGGGDNTRTGLHLQIYFRTVISDIGGIMQMGLSRSLKILKCGMIVATGAGQGRTWTLASWHSSSRNMALQWISRYLDTLLHVDYCWCSARLAGNHIIPAPIFGPPLTTFSVFLPRLSLSLTITSLNQNTPALFPRLLHIMKLGVIVHRV